MILEQHPTLLALSADDMLRLADELRECAGGGQESERIKDWFDAEIQKGLDDFREGRTVPGDQVRARMDAYVAEWKARRAN